MLRFPPNTQYSFEDIPSYCFYIILEKWKTIAIEEARKNFNQMNKIANNKN